MRRCSLCGELLNEFDVRFKEKTSNPSRFDYNFCFHCSTRDLRTSLNRIEVMKKRKNLSLQQMQTLIAVLVAAILMAVIYSVCNEIREGIVGYLVISLILFLITCGLRFLF